MASKITTCKTCGAEIAKSAKKCPQCGAKIRHPFKTLFKIILVLVIIVVVLSVISGSGTPTLSKQASEMSKDAFIAACEPVNYTDVARTPDSFKDKLITFHGRVVQVQEGSTLVLRVAQDDGSGFSSDYWYITYKKDNSGVRILEEDKLTVYGECKGTYSYKSIFGAQITIPSMAMAYYELDK